jgi:hypothetical protein
MDDAKIRNFYDAYSSRLPSPALADQKSQVVSIVIQIRRADYNGAQAIAKLCFILNSSCLAFRSSYVDTRRAVPYMPREKSSSRRNGQPQRTWRDVAREIDRETDTKRFLKLTERLNECMLEDERQKVLRRLGRAVPQFSSLGPF